jgi:hypothetical protein
MFIESQGFVTGISRFTPNKYELLNNMVIDQTIAEHTGKNTTMDEDDASIECTRRGCSVFVREKKDGSTTYYQLTNYPYLNDDHQDQLGYNKRYNLPKLKEKSSKLEQQQPQQPVRIISSTKNNNNNNNNNLWIILIFIALIVLVLFMISGNNTPTYTDLVPGVSESLV